MKEKISCSLDGDLVDAIDELLYRYPYIATRSAFLEMACYMLIDWCNEFEHYGIDKCDKFVQLIYERRCELNAQKESTNRNI